MRLKNYFIGIILTLLSCQPKYVTPEPVIHSFAPASGKTGTLVTISGSSFGKKPAISINGANASISSISLTGGTFSTEQVIVVVPFGATTGKVRLSNEGGVAISKVNFVVTQ